MELCQEEDGEVVEQLAPEQTFNPTIQYFNQVVTDRMMDPGAAMPQVNPAILEQMQVDREANGEVFDDAFEIVYQDEEKDQKEKKKRVYWRDLIAAEEGKVQAEATVEEQQIATEEQATRLKMEKGDGAGGDKGPKHIGTVNPIDDFKAMVSDRKVDRVDSALNQLRDIIDRYVRGSTDGDLHPKALEMLKELRKTCVNEDEAPFFNKAITVYKEKFSGGAQAGFWLLVTKGKISLITCMESEFSSVVSPKEAEDFLKLNAPAKNKSDMDMII